MREQGSAAVANALGVSNPTALQWAREGISVPTTSSIDALSHGLSRTPDLHQARDPLHHVTPTEQVTPEHRHDELGL